MGDGAGSKNASRNSLENAKMRARIQVGKYKIARVLEAMKTLLWSAYECRIVGIYIGKSLGQMGRRYEGGEGGHEERMSKMTHLADRLHTKCSEHV